MQIFYLRDTAGNMMAGSASSAHRPSESPTVVVIKNFDKGISHYTGESTTLEIMPKSSEFVFEDAIEVKRFDSVGEAFQYFLSQYLERYADRIHTHNFIDNIFFDPSQEFVASLETLFGWMK
jgi:hypothetical protein